MKVLITADLHISNHKSDNRRIEDGLQCLEWMYQTGVQQGCRYLFFAGDFMHHRFSLHAMAYAKACRLVSDYADKGIKTIFVLGNHDMFYEDDWLVNSLAPLRKCATVIETPTTLVFDGIPVDFLPYTPTPSKYLPEFKKPSKTLISHLAILSAKLHAKYDILSVEDDSKEKEVIAVEAFDKWEKVWLGHYHYGQKLGRGNVEYIGSPMQLTFGEAGQKKSVVIFNLETLESEYIENTISPRFHIIENEADVDKVDVTNSYVEMRTKEDIQCKFDLRNRLAKLGAREIEFVSKKRDMVKATKAMDDIVALVHQKEKMIEGFVKQLKLNDGLDDARRIKIGIEIVSS